VKSSIVDSEGRSSLGAAKPMWPGPHGWMVGLVALVGVIVRVAVMMGPLGRPDSDEAVAGLMARHLDFGQLFNGGFPAYFAGQHYGGTLELVPVSVSIGAFGSSVAALRAPTLMLGVLNAVLIWRIARRIMPEARARIAGLLAWIWPAASVWFGGREMLFYVPTVTLGLVAMLLALRIWAIEGRARRAWIEWAGFGLAIGIGWWSSPNIVYFVVPAVALIVVGSRQRWWIVLPRWTMAGVALVAAIVGALPWLATNLGSGLVSLHDSDGFPPTGTYLTRLGWFFTDGLPAELGFRSMGTLQWIGGIAGILVAVIALGAVGLAIRAAWRDRDSSYPVAPPDVVGLVCFPFLLAVVPFAMAQANLRYLFFIAPFLCLVVARLAVTRNRAISLLVIALLVTGVGLARLYAVSETPGTVFKVGAVDDLSGAISVLDSEHIDAVYADYWIAYRLAFESSERIRAVPSAGTHRSSHYLAAVEASDEVAWVVPVGDAQLTALTGALDSLGVSWRTIDAGGFVVVIPDRPVTPHEVPNDARAPAGSEMAPPPGHTY